MIQVVSFEHMFKYLLKDPIEIATNDKAMANTANDLLSEGPLHYVKPQSPQKYLKGFNFITKLEELMTYVQSLHTQRIMFSRT